MRCTGTTRVTSSGTPRAWDGPGFDWALRMRAGALARFRPCGPDLKSVCSIVSYRDTDGHVTSFRRDAAGRLLRIVAPAGSAWIAFEYDGGDRVSRASDSTGQRSAPTSTDHRGRLVGVKRNGAVTHRYTYTERDEMATIVEPGTDIENTLRRERPLHPPDQSPW